MGNRSMTSPPKPGTMLAFIAEHVDVARPRQDETDRLLPMIENAGFKTTRGSVLQAMSVVRRLQNAPPPERRRRQSSPIARSPKHKQNPRIEALEGFVDDALKGLTMLKGELRRLNDIEKKYLTIKAQLT